MRFASTGTIPRRSLGGSKSAGFGDGRVMNRGGIIAHRRSRTPGLRVLDRYVIEVAKLGDSRLTAVGRDAKVSAAEIGQLREHRLVAALDIVEQFFHPRRYRVILADLFLERIDVLASLLHRKVEVRPGRKAGRA